jgi:hypothetical protein
MKKLPDFWGIRNIIFVFIETVHWIRSWAKRTQSQPTPQLMSSARSVFSAHLILIDLTIIIIIIIIIIYEEHKLWRSTLCNRSDILCCNHLIPYNVVLCEKISVTYHVTSLPHPLYNWIVHYSPHKCQTLRSMQLTLCRIHISVNYNKESG